MLSCRGLGLLPGWVLAFVGSKRVGMEEGLRWLVPASTNNCGAKADEILRVYTAVVLATGFFSVESCWVCLHSKRLGTVVTPSKHLILMAPAFLLCY